MSGKGRSGHAGVGGVRSSLWAHWVGRRSPADVSGVTGMVGAVGGVMVGIASSSTQVAATAAGLGTAVAGGVGLLVWSAARRWAGPIPAEAGARTIGSSSGASAAVGVPALVPPADTVHFVDRAEETAAVARILGARRVGSGTSAVCIVHGMPGVGKTALAVRVARRMAARFPDGCLYINLHGHTPGTSVVSAAEALDRLLRRLGVGAHQIPQHVEDRAAAFRDRLAGRRMLLVLDDALDAGQVAALLPAEPRCGVLVTSRNRLAALDDAGAVHVRPLAPSVAADLLRTVAGGPLSHEGLDPAIVAEVVESCAYLPLAIRIVGARLQGQDRTSLADLAGELADERHRLALLDDGERSVVASVATSYVGLSDDQRQLLANLASHVGVDVDAFSAAALSGLGPVEAGRNLDLLAERHLLVRHRPARYRFHDLVRAIARERVAPDAATPGSEPLGRLVDYYLTVAERADTAITPHRYRVDLDVAHPPSPVDVPDVATYDRGLAWLTDEEDNLVAACHAAGRAGLDVACWQLARTLKGYFFLTKRWTPWTATHEVALAATRRLGDRRAEAMILDDLGVAAIEQEQLDRAEALYLQALELFRSVGDRFGVHTALVNHAWVSFHRGGYDEFLERARPVLDFYRDAGAERNAAITLRGIALAEVELGQLSEAISHLEEALGAFTQLGLRLDAVMALNALGEAHARAGDPVQSADHHRRAVGESAACGSVFENARAHHRLGDVALEAGDRRGARAHLQEALLHYRSLGAPQAKEVIARLAGFKPRRLVRPAGRRHRTGPAVD